MQRAPRPQRTAVDLDSLTVDVAACATTQVHHDAGDVLWPAEPSHGVGLGVLLEAAADLEQATGHLCREPTRADGVYEDVSLAELDGQVATQVQHGGLGRRVPVRSLGAERAYSQPSDAGGDDHAGRIIDRSPLLEHGLELLDRIENRLHVEVHYLAERVLRVCLERLAPCRARVGQEDVDRLGVFPDLRDERLDTRQSGRVGGHRDGSCAWL